MAALENGQEVGAGSFGITDTPVGRDAFKQYVHDRLDAMGVPHTVKESPHTDAGCRVGGRLDYVEAKLATPAAVVSDALVAELIAAATEVTEASACSLAEITAIARLIKALAALTDKGATGRS